MFTIIWTNSSRMNYAKFARTNSHRDIAGRMPKSTLSLSDKRVYLIMVVRTYAEIEIMYLILSRTSILHSIERRRVINKWFELFLLSCDSMRLTIFTRMRKKWQRGEGNDERKSSYEYIHVISSRFFQDIIPLQNSSYETLLFSA